MTEQLPLFFGRPITETKLSLSGGITDAMAQPARVMHQMGERVVLIVVGVTDGAAQGQGEAGVVWTNKVKLLEAYELSDKADADRLLERARRQTADSINERTGVYPLSNAG